jgi:hypothetical protein
MRVGDWLINIMFLYGDDTDHGIWRLAKWYDFTEHVLI